MSIHWCCLWLYFSVNNECFSSSRSSSPSSSSTDSFHSSTLPSFISLGSSSSTSPPVKTGKSKINSGKLNVNYDVAKPTSNGEIK